MPKYNENIVKLINKMVHDYKDKIHTKHITDGYHTFEDLYDHRAKLFAMLVANYPERSWKSKQHYDGTMFGHKEDESPMFIVGIHTPAGDYSYHYHMEYWGLFPCKELERAPEWDGHKPEDIDRIFSLLK